MRRHSNGLAMTKLAATKLTVTGLAAAMVLLAGSIPAVAQERSGSKPNILVIFGDDIGTTNVSAYSDGLMGYETPHIDRLAKEGFAFSITMPNNPAPPDAPRSSPASTAFARD
jgi:hypothetical protein